MSDDAKMSAAWTNLMADSNQGVEMQTRDERATSVMSGPAIEEDDLKRPVIGGANLKSTDRYTWDAVFVFAVGSEESTVKVFDEDKGERVKITEKEHFQNTTADIVTRLENAGLKTDMFLSVQKDEIYVRVGASEKRLEQEADRIDYDLQLDHERCLEAGRLLEIKLAEATTSDDVDDVTEREWLHIYGPYDQLDPEHVYRQELYKRYPDEELGIRNNSFFTPTDRLKLTMNIIEADFPLGGAEISVTKAVAEARHSMLAFFPLHQQKKKQALMTRWFQWSSTFKSPLDDIRSYFGESIGFYFAFLQFYNKALVLPALLGLGFFIWQLVANRVDVEGLPAFAVVISVWATIFLELWKRKESQYRVRWGMTKFKELEQPRPEFEGEWRPSPVDGRKIEYFPWITKVWRAFVSQTVIWSLIGVVIASVIGIFLFRSAIQDSVPGALGNYITAFINAIQIQILNVIYGIVSYKLNSYENHRTDTEYENALIAKTFLFKFINSYNSLFYIAFFKKNDSTADGCQPSGDCLAELAQQLGTIFITAIVINNATEILLPMVKSRYATYSNRELNEDGTEVEKSPPEVEFELEPYESTFDDFDELIIQFGYVTIFVVAFPLAPFLALLNNVLEVRVDSTKLCLLSRRPEPRGAYDIGTWYDILNIVSVIAVVVNVGIIAFETQLVTDWADNDGETKAYIFIIAEHIILLLKFAIAYFVPDEPEAVANHRLRQDFLVNVLIKGVEEEADDPEEAAEKGPSTKHIDFNWEARLSDRIRDSGREW